MRTVTRGGTTYEQSVRRRRSPTPPDAPTDDGDRQESAGPCVEVVAALGRSSDFVFKIVDLTSGRVSPAVLEEQAECVAELAGILAANGRSDALIQFYAEYRPVLACVHCGGRRASGCEHCGHFGWVFAKDVDAHLHHAVDAGTIGSDAAARLRRMVLDGVTSLHESEYEPADDVRPDSRSDEHPHRQHRTASA